MTAIEYRKHMDEGISKLKAALAYAEDGTPVGAMRCMELAAAEFAEASRIKTALIGGALAASRG